MKKSELIAKYLFINKAISLAGLGRFEISSESTAAESESPLRKEKKDLAGKIEFIYNTHEKTDEKLVDFIARQTGKMKSLAASDLESFTEEIKQFINIGNPYTIDGIGTLLKGKNGKVIFTQVNELEEPELEMAPEVKQATTEIENSFSAYDEAHNPLEKESGNWKKYGVVLILILIVSAGAWVGYRYFFKKKDTAVQTEKNLQPVLQTMDTLVNIDTVKTPVAAINSDTVFYNFIIEKASLKRAVDRYNYLKSLGIDVQMKTNDSLLFKLYFHLPALPSDTSRLKDSLTRLYGSLQKTSIE